MTIYINIDEYDDFRAYSDDPADVGKTVRVLKDDDEEESDLAMKFFSDQQYRVRDWGQATVEHKTWDLGDYEEEEEEENPSYEHHFICPECHEHWTEKNDVYHGDVEEYCKKFENGDGCKYNELIHPYKTVDL